MKVPTAMRERGLKFNLTPLIDIVFLLIIFFLVASYIAGTESVDRIELARAATGRLDPEEAPRRIVATVREDGSVQVGSQERSTAEFEELIREARGDETKAEVEVRIRADRHVPYRVIEPLLTACARAGVLKIRFNVLPKI